MNSRTPVVIFASDANFAGVTSVAIRSLSNNACLEPGDVYVLALNLSEEDKLLMRQAARDWVCHFVDVEAYLNTVESYDVELERVPAISAARLAIDELLPSSIDQALYLDSDLMVVGSLEGLYSVDMSTAIVAGVLDRMEPTHLRCIGLNEDSSYLNAGVLLLNVRIMRKVGFGSRCLDFLKTAGKKAQYLDQDAINAMSDGAKQVLPLQYNVMPPNFFFSHDQYLTYRPSKHPYYDEGAYAAAVNNPSIVHFANSFTYKRPWYAESRHPFAQAYWQLMDEMGVPFFPGRGDGLVARAWSATLRQLPPAASPRAAAMARQLKSLKSRMS